jgi:hypothetical protein
MHIMNKYCVYLGQSKTCIVVLLFYLNIITFAMRLSFVLAQSKFWRELFLFVFQGKTKHKLTVEF